MHPVLIDFGNFKLYSYGLMLFLAFTVGLAVANVRGRQKGLPKHAVTDIALGLIIAGLVGSRILYVFTHLDEFRGNWWATVIPIQPDGSIGMAGLVFLGGVIPAIGTLLVMAYVKKLNLLLVLDVFAPSLAIGSALGRIGCFLNGCCFGLPTEGPLSVVFPPGCPAHAVYPGETLLPTQLFAASAGFTIFAVLLLSERFFRTFKGFATSLFFILYGTFRMFNDGLRYQEAGLRLIEWDGGFITVSQFLAFGLVLVGLALFLWQRKRSLQEPIQTL
ncbi:hypothetical protein GF324_02810 [bacterium]|nr:hypothetical protein [bacterium]